MGLIFNCRKQHCRNEVVLLKLSCLSLDGENAWVSWAIYKDGGKSTLAMVRNFIGLVEAFICSNYLRFGR